ncbi:hypothetical protein BN1213_02445 [Mycobacterium tuberculosis]|nr:hypothetical protein BN1213_02445 [Mycobacterium tuberculosis]
MSAWFNYTATLKILIFSLLAGALLPGLLYLPVGAVAKPYVAAICDSTWVWRPGRPSRCDAR